MLDVLMIIFRSVIFFILLFLFTKWLRKKQIAQFQIFDYISGVVLGGIVAIHASTVDISMIYGIVSLVVWFVITRLLEYISLHSNTFRKFQNKTTPIIINGNILHENMKKERYLYEELLADLRLKNVFDISQIEIAYLENTGELSIKQKASSNSPNLLPKNSKHPIVIDGKIIQCPFAQDNDLEQQLKSELKRNELSIENIVWADLQEQTFLNITAINESTFPEHKIDELAMIHFKKLLYDLQMLKQLNIAEEALDQLYNDYAQIQKHAINKIKSLPK